MEKKKKSSGSLGFPTSKMGLNLGKAKASPPNASKFFLMV